ncbi:MAG: hypothetical protein GXY48_01045 [Methanomicrobiales archaeon]|nr:hypothetical protein [Methanomicrobiales archaeon]
MRTDDAESSTLGMILIIVIIIILGIIVLLLAMGFLPINPVHDSLVPAFIKIIGINHSGTRLESQVVIRSFYSEELDNDQLMARLKVNGNDILACITTLQGHNFIPTRHFGVKNIKGSGCKGQFFSPGEIIVIDLKNGYIKPGDTVELKIYEKTNERISLPAPGNLLNREYMEEYEAEYLFNQMKDCWIFSQHKFVA